MKLKITESQYNLLVEQNLGKIFSKILKSGDELAQSMSKAIRNINPDVANKFIKYEVKTVDDFVNHLETFKSIWVPILKGESIFNKTVSKFNELKNLTPEKINQVKIIYEKNPEILITLKRGLPKELHSIYDTMFFDNVLSKKVNKYSNISDDVTIVKDTKTNTNVVKSTVNDNEEIINNFIKNTDKENFKQLENLHKNNVIDANEYWFFLKNPKEWFTKKSEFNITSTKNKLDVTVDSLLDELPTLTDGEIRKRIELYTLMGRDDLVKILKKEIDTPKNVKQVAGVKVDISDSDLEKINSSVKKRGTKNWGMVDDKSNIPIYEEIVVNGDKVYLSFNQKGPLIKKSNLPAWVDSVEIEAREAMQLGITPFGDIPPDFLPNYIEKFKEQLKLNPENTKGLKFEDIYFNYPVALGARVTDSFDNKWIVINPKKIGDYYGGNVVDEIIHTIEHELVHVNQPSAKTKINQYGYIIKTEKDALKILQSKKSSPVISKEFKMIGSMDSFKSRLKDVGLEKEFNEFLEKFRKETGKDVYRADTGEFTSYFMKYFSESNFNEKFATKIENGKKVPDPKKMLFIGAAKRKNKPVFNTKDKAKSYRYFIEREKLNSGIVEKGMMNNILEKSDSELVDIVENNKKYYTDQSNGKILSGFENYIKSLENVLMRSSNELTYFSNIIEIEAEFTALIKDILRKGTDVDNKGFTTFLVDWLRKDRAGKIDDLINKDKTPLKNMSSSSREVLGKMSSDWINIFPDIGKKLYSDMYRQLYNLIKNKYPALLPLVPATFTMLNEPKTQNESIKKFNKLIITESQYKLLKEFKKKAYSFDWDDNILVMPTRIHLDYNVNSNDIADLGSEGNKVWVPVSVSTEQFRSVRHKLGKEFRYPNDDILSAFKDFRDYDAFIEDTKRALSYRSYGPSFNKFKEALISGSDFSIITARSNPPKAIKEGIKEIIRDMSWGEQKEMEKNLNGLSIDEYLNLQDYHPVSSEEFSKRFGLESVGTNPEEGKKIAFKSFVDRIVSQISKIKDDEDFEGISVGFSDDDEGNIEVIEDLIRDELKRLYPDITFTVYDTSDPKDTKKKRIIIKK